MKASRPRLRVLVTLFLLAMAGVVVQLFGLMIEQNERWLERSYRNRWAFKDVPTRRGSILDRTGVPLVADQPCFALHLHYRSFRRRHPIGLAVHGANLMMAAQGIGDDIFRFEGERNGPLQACAQLLDLPVAWLRPGRIGDEAVLDLRFYAGGLLASLAQVPSNDVRRALREAITTDHGGTIGDLLGSRSRQRMLDAFAARMRELDEFDGRLRELAAGESLFGSLERSRQALWADKPSERVMVTLRREVTFDIAIGLASRHERHPGLYLRPSVTRKQSAVVADVPSLQPLLGTVTPFWKQDAASIDQQVDAMLAAGVGESGPGEDLPEDIAATIEVEAAEAARLHFMNLGRTGRGGVEDQLDERLSGRPGLRWVERDKRAHEQALWNNLDVTPGESVRLSVDLRLQQHLEAAFAAAWADPLENLDQAREVALAVIDPRTGEVLALGGRPLLAGDQPRQFSPAVAWTRGAGYVGSVAKPFVLIEYLESLARQPGVRHFRDFRPCDQRYERIAGTQRYLSCSGNHGEDACDCARALARSCNFFYFQAAEAIGREGLERAYHRVGWLFQKTPEPGVRIEGLNWQPPRKKLGKALLQNQAIGYGVEVNALLVARAYAGLATGVLPHVTLIAGDGDDARVPLLVEPRILDVVLDGMRACITEGTAHGIPALLQCGVLGKTGTAEIDANKRNNAWFAGFVTRARPTMAFAAVAYDVPDAEHGGEGVARLVARFLDRVAGDLRLQPTYLPEVEAR